MIDLPGLWREHQHAAFPASAMELLPIDVRAGALLTESLRSDGLPRALPPEKRELLRRALEQAVEALGPLDPAGRAYFERLVALGRAVLAATPDGGGSRSPPP